MRNNVTSQIETREIADDELDGVAGGIGGAVQIEAAGNADLPMVAGLAVPNALPVAGQVVGTVTGLVGGLTGIAGL